MADCPTDFHRCKLDALPCVAEPEYRCPYYRFADQQLYGNLTGSALEDTDTEYWGALANATLASCNGTFLTLAAGKVGWVGGWWFVWWLLRVEVPLL